MSKLVSQDKACQKVASEKMVPSLCLLAVTFKMEIQSGVLIKSYIIILYIPFNLSAFPVRAGFFAYFTMKLFRNFQELL